jgi:hypothetical protein
MLFLVGLVRILKISLATLKSPLEASVIGDSGQVELYGTRGPHGASPAILVKPAFKLVFLTVATITILCGIGEIAMASVWTAPTQHQDRAFEAIGFGWKAGIGAIFGLLGGKGL